VDPDERERIFEAYRQGSHAAIGSGVGLALVATFAELHGGRAWVQQREGGGASFRVLLAWDPPAPPDPPDDEAQPTGTGSSAESQA
jgi:signal transduction histidine kinase